LLTPAIAGCATIEGSPRRLLDETVSMALVNNYRIDEAIRLFSLPDDAVGIAARGGLTRQQFRDMVVIVYMNAMDGRYYAFRTALSSERRQTGLGMDLAVLGITGWASVARDSIVNNLSAIAAGLGSARSAIDRNLYFDQTLPALLSAMDAQRLRARAQIMRNLQRPAGDYPLPTAFSDLMSYEVASTLDSAVAEITANAALDRQQAQQELAAATPACRADEGSAAVSDRIMAYVDRFAPDPDTGAISNANLLKLVRIAAAIEVPPGWTSGEDLYEAIQERISTGQEGRCRAADLEALITRIQTAIEE
jgi:hypothetical protein